MTRWEIQSGNGPFLQIPMGEDKAALLYAAAYLTGQPRTNGVRIYRTDGAQQRRYVGYVKRAGTGEVAYEPAQRPVHRPRSGAIGRASAG